MTALVRVLALTAELKAAGSTLAERLDEARLEFERRFIRAALARAGGRRNLAASQLGLSRQGLGKIIRRLGIIES